MRLFLPASMVVFLSLSASLAVGADDRLTCSARTTCRRGPVADFRAVNAPCTYCHVPHSGNGNLAPLWNQKLSTSTYTTYTSTTAQNTDNPKPPLGSQSSFCLACHDGTVATGDTVLFGKIAMSGSMYPQDNFGTQLQGSHPFSLTLPLKDSTDLVASIYQNGKTADPKVRLIRGNIECTSCHNPHVQANDLISHELSGARQLQRPAVYGMSRSQPYNDQQDQSGCGLGHQHSQHLAE